MAKIIMKCIIIYLINLLNKYIEMGLRYFYFGNIKSITQNYTIILGFPRVAMSILVYVKFSFVGYMNAILAYKSPIMNRFVD